MSNPFSKCKGFSLRVYYAIKVIKGLGRNPLSSSARNRVFNNRKFDNCFENGDADAVVYAIMEATHQKKDIDLLRGIEVMGQQLLEDWNNHYWKAKNQQLPLF